MSGAGGADGAKKRGAAAAYTLVEKMDVARHKHYMENRATNQDYPQRLGNKHPPAADGTVTQLIHCSHPGCKAKHKIVAASSGTEWTLWVADIPHVHDETLVKQERCWPWLLLPMHTLRIGELIELQGLWTDWPHCPDCPN